MDIATKLTDLVSDLSECRRAITYRGGEISATAGFKEVAEKIASLPASSSIGTVVDESSSLLKIVPVDSTKYCYLKSLGGMTYKCNNLIPFPYYEGSRTVNGVTVTVNADGSIALNGTATGIVALTLANGLPFPKGTYTISGFPSSMNGYGYLAVVFQKGTNYVAELVDRGSGATRNASSYDFDNIRIVLRFETGAKCNNLVVKPMLNAGTTALPYEPYYEGLRDNKATAIKNYGANLIPFPYFGNKGVGHTQTLNGLTFTVNEDRSVTINGTATGTTSYYILRNMPISAGTYSFSVKGISVIRALPSLIRKDTSAHVKNFTQANTTSPTTTFTVTTDEVKECNLCLHFYIYADEVLNNVRIYPMLNKGSVAVPYTDYHEPITYPIPYELQGTGKGVEGAADTIDFETSKAITKVKTIALGDVGGYQMMSLGGTENAYVSDDGVVSVFSYNLNDFDSNLRTKALCSHLPFTSDWTGKTVGVCLPSGTARYVKVSIRAEDAGVTTADNYNTITSKIVAWLKDNNVTLTYAVAEPTTEDIDTSAFDNLIEVEGGGSLEIITDNGMAVPTTFIYQTIV